MIKVKYVLFMIIILIASCEKEAENVKYPEYVPKTIVWGFITPDVTQNRIQLSSSLSLYGRFRYPSYETVKITISDNQRELTMDFDTIQMGYFFKSSEFPITAGKNYTLNITGEKGLTASGSCTVPQKRNFALEMDTTKFASSYYYNDTLRYYTTIYADLIFTDIKDEPNYYTIFSETVIYNSSYHSNPYVIQMSNDDPESIINLYEKNYFSDKDIDGKRIRISFGGISDPVKSDSAFIKIYLLNIDKTYFDFKKSLDNYSSGENPFIEPSPVYSNISGGLGIFASYTMDSLILRLK